VIARKIYYAVVSITMVHCWL